MAKMKINKGLSWKECFLGERMRRWGLWFIITFLAAMTIRDITLLVPLQSYMKTLDYQRISCFHRNFPDKKSSRK